MATARTTVVMLGLGEAVELGEPVELADADGRGRGLGRGCVPGLFEHAARPKLATTTAAVAASTLSSRVML
ncbi:MAG TPA: hypothetical protein VMV12_02280 [Candidatus Micrarchaeaceae archaeon]|nr:hypothetical protein [Candidatus Micrarchaeaceae archaeon]